MAALRIIRRLAQLLDVLIVNPQAGDFVGYDNADQKWKNLVPAGGGGGAPDDADYLVGSAQAGLSAEIVVGASPGGELGGTWATPTVDTVHSGSSHAAVQTAAEATAAAALAGHDADTTGIHGIADTSALETTIGAQAKVDTHVNDATDAHDASAISSVPAGALAATDVQTALNELDTEKAAAASAVMDGDAAGGVLSGTYPNPGFAVDMSTQAELDVVSAARLPGVLLFDSLLGGDAASIDSGAGGFSTDYKHLLIYVYFRTTEVAVASNALLRFNGDAGANYDEHDLRVINTTVSGALTLAGTEVTLGGFGASAQSGAFAQHDMAVANYAATVGHKTIRGGYIKLEDTAADCRTGCKSARWRSTAAITRVSITAASGNLLAGSRMTIYALA